MTLNLNQQRRKARQKSLHHLIRACGERDRGDVDRNQAIFRQIEDVAQKVLKI